MVLTAALLPYSGNTYSGNTRSSLATSAALDATQVTAGNREWAVQHGLSADGMVSGIVK